MSAMQGGDNVDPMQIMMMTQLLKDEDENADGATEKGSKYNVCNFSKCHFSSL